MRGALLGGPGREAAGSSSTPSGSTTAPRKERVSFKAVQSVQTHEHSTSKRLAPNGALQLAHGSTKRARGEGPGVEADGDFVARTPKVKCPIFAFFSRPPCTQICLIHIVVTNLSALSAAKAIRGQRAPLDGVYTESFRGNFNRHFRRFVGLRRGGELGCIGGGSTMLLRPTSSVSTCL